MELIEIILIFAAGAFVGYRVANAFMMIAFKKMAEEAGLTANDLKKFADHHAQELGINQDENGYDVVEIKVEQHGDALYVFRKDNDQFLGQGTDKEDLIRRLGEKLKNVRLVIDQDDGAELIGGSFNFDVTTKEIKKH